MKLKDDLQIKIFADGANKTDMLKMYQNPFVKGFTTNPSLMCQAGIRDYESFAHDILACIPDRSISFEIFADDMDEMERQAIKIASFSENVYVKIPYCNTLGESTTPLIRRLAKAGVKQNVTALMTLKQVEKVTEALREGPSAYVSIFAGRIADTGRDPLPIMRLGLEIIKPYPQLEMIWASPREPLNIFQADDIGCHIITVTQDILKKLAIAGKDLEEFSLETVKGFREDALKAGFQLKTDELIEV